MSNIKEKTERTGRVKNEYITFAPGARIVVRDAEWLVRRVDRTSTGGQALTVTGISELVRDKEAIFLTEIDKNIEILDPVDTNLVRDESSSYQASLLYMESLLRRKPPTDLNLYTGHKAAMDPVPYKLDPAIQALKQPRQRILIADAVGLGKTWEAGVLRSELIRRGKGKRILVLAVKSMLTQFQKEMWSRFTIPLVRLDSIGIQRIRSRIPTNYNPFYYYDKAIISIDTLKQDREYRTYLENAYWDIIVIDEAHNIAERGTSSSLRSKLANLLSSRSDTLIMLSATPHDGKARSFASIMNMLDPTAIANSDDYGPDDIQGLYIRRFKKDPKCVCLVANIAAGSVGGNYQVANTVVFFESPSGTIARVQAEKRCSGARQTLFNRAILNLSRHRCQFTRRFAAPPGSVSENRHHRFVRDVMYALLHMPVEVERLGTVAPRSVHECNEQFKLRMLRYQLCNDKGVGSVPHGNRKIDRIF